MVEAILDGRVLVGSSTRISRSADRAVPTLGVFFCGVVSLAVSEGPKDADGGW
jgi:hypothetical protein